MVEYPNPSRKLRSQEELVRLMGARDERGQRLYDVDEYYRRCVEQMVSNGYELSDGPQTAFKSDEAVVLREGDFDRTRERLGLEQERDRLQLQVESEERQAVIDSAKGIPGTEKPKVEPLTREQLMRAMSTPEYRNNEAYRRHIEDRIAATDVESGDFNLQINPNRQHGF